ncbi:flavin reductase family protein [Pullulanibacillus sp. KACC 23026]|uniref:flavin reductase family protein n=1 Tax=Pullulanibacillus sp. KACC 23026 TaxID=3028315 RepID=UPI0023B1390F|nr:flavin reductase family protein [Pullulanibacillus sp. KACC 23026]WEG12982.1 flavin reductase family protein [Pullulanibacillus sp. KACC 23026]
MLGIDPNQLSGRDNYKFLSGSIIPRPVAFVTTLSPKGVVNAAPFSFFNIVASEPPLISISVQRDGELQKDTAAYALERGQFVVHISTETHIEEINKTASRREREESELDLTSLHTTESVRVEVPGIKEAPIRMECVIEKALELGGTAEQGPTCDLLIGRVVYYHIEESLYDNGRIDPFGLKPVARLAGNDYSKLGSVFELIRPK